ESVYDQPFSDILAAEVFTPSGMSSAGVQQPPPSGGYDGPPIVMHLASGYNGAPGARQEAMPKMYVIPGAGGLYATAADVGAFARALFSGELLSPASRAEMVRLPPGSEKGYALGIVVVGRDEERFFRHDGGTNGYVSWLQHFPANRTTVVILSNYGFAPIRDLAAAVVAAVAGPPRASATEKDPR
ncbi:MAG: serine hydrolase domain-containing protein, partial [Thermoanaerobaculia bacterium]|nr:serine hydrolase domain-containing protein [Thermoanaerobaculia bacterium]